MTESTPPPDQRSDQRWSTDEPAAADAPGTSTPASAPSSYATAPSSTTAVVTQGRPGIVTAGGITLIVLGALWLLIGVAALLIGGVFASGEASETIPELDALALGAFGGMLLFIAILALLFGAVQIWVGINALGGRSWARITGIVLSVIGAALFVGGLLGAGAGTATEQSGSPIFNIVFIVAYLFVIYALATGGRWFSARTV